METMKTDSAKSSKVPQTDSNKTTACSWIPTFGTILKAMVAVKSTITTLMKAFIPWGQSKPVMALPVGRTQSKSMPDTIVNPKVQSSWGTFTESNKYVLGSTEGQWVSLEDVCAARETWAMRNTDLQQADGVAAGYMALYKEITGKSGKHTKSESDSSFHTLTYDDQETVGRSGKNGKKCGCGRSAKRVDDRKRVRKAKKKNPTAYPKNAKQGTRKKPRENRY
jgi:hypothetical protein